MKKITQKLITDTLKKLGHTFFDQGEFNLNLIGIRSNDTGTNTFNDVFVVLFKQAGNWVMLQFDCTTDPGQFYLKNPLNVHGCAIVKPDQFKGLWELGHHRNQYKALKQKAPVTVYRDNNGDGVLDFENPVTENHIGINCHRTTKKGESEVVNKWSAGCQVFANDFDFQILISLCEKSASLYGNSFTYTLINETDL